MHGIWSSDAATRSTAASGIARVGIGLLLLAGVSACSDDAPQIRAGVCVASETRDEGHRVPNLSTIVPCSQPHVYEVFDVVDLPRELWSDTLTDTRDELAIPNEFADDSPLRQVYEAFSERRCAQSLQRATGYDSLRVNGKSAATVRLIPAMRGIEAPWYSVMPEEQWRKGRHQVVCSARFAVPTASGGTGRLVEPRRSPGESMLLSFARTNRFPARLRPCRAYNADRTNLSQVSCTKKHVSETLFYFEAPSAIGQKFVAGLVADPTAEKFNELDKVCTKALPQLLGKDFDKAKQRGFASVPRKWTRVNKPIQCAVGPIDFKSTDLPGGSLVDLDAKAAPKPRMRTAKPEKPAPSATTPQFRTRPSPGWLNP